jgi:hypothetical protein
MSNSELLGGSNRSLLKDGNLVINGFGSSKSTTSNSLALGNSAGAFNQDISAVAIGAFAGSSGQLAGSIAIGANCCQTGQGVNSVAIGMNAKCSNTASIAIGANASITQGIEGSICIGRDAINNGEGICIGKASKIDVSVVNGIAIGNQAEARATSSIAIGGSAITNGNHQLVFGGGNGVIVGQNGMFVSSQIARSQARSGLRMLCYNPSTGEITFDTVNQ